MKKFKNNVGADASVRPTSKAGQNKGITLIALVITIIVMLILVAVTISMAVNGGLFNYAGKASGDTQNAIDKEQELASGKVTIGETTYNSIDEYLGTSGENGTDDGTGEEVAVVPNPEETFSAIYTQNTTITQGEYTAVIPKGFAVGTSQGISTIANGLVITDKVNEEGKSVGNEFVWIPVEVTDTDTETSIASFYRSEWSSNARSTSLMDSTTHLEPYTDGYDGEEAEYYEMVKSVYKNKGFYIGRYEAGSTTARTNVANGTTEMVVKRDAYPYNYVGWGLTMTDYTSDVTWSNKNQGKGALYLSKAMYAGKDVGATSTLCYGIQWDAMLDFIKDADHNVTTSTTWGNCCGNAWTIERKTAKYSEDNGKTWSLIDDEEGDEKTKDNETQILLTTGASDDFTAKNIFDVAGNCYEYTSETWNANSRVIRGRLFHGRLLSCV